jgi:hypothetical protein
MYERAFHGCIHAVAKAHEMGKITRIPYGGAWLPCDKRSFRL